MPVATTLKVAVAGATTDLFTGWVVIRGAAFTVSVATDEITLPAVLVTTQRYFVPLIAVVVAPVV